jgi:hypothetical protein
MGAFILVKFNGAESEYRRPPIYDRVTSETRPVEAIKFRMEQSGLGIPAEMLIAQTLTG